MLGILDIQRILRDVFGGGADISAANPLEVHDPKVGSLISYEGITTANGAPLGASLVCSDLTTKPDFDSNLVIITSGVCAGQARDINGVTTGGTVTPSIHFGSPTGAGVQIVSGTSFVIVGITTTPAEVAAIEAKLDHAAHGLAALKALIDAVEGKLDGASGLAAIKAVVDAILVDTETTLEGKLDTIAGYLDTEVAAILAAVDTEVAAVEGKLDGVSGLAAIKAVVDAILVDTETTLEGKLDAIGLVTAALPTFPSDPADQSDVEAAITAAHGTTDGKVDTVDGIVDNIILDTQIRKVQSGIKAIDAAATKYLHIDSGTNGAEILAIIIKGVVGADWTVDVYVPTDDAVAAPAAGDMRDSFTYVLADTKGGLLGPLGIAYNMFLNFTNDSAGADNIDDCVIVYRSRAALTLSWEA